MKPLIRKLLQNDPLPELAEFVEVRRSERAKKLALRLDTKKRAFTLVVPKRISMRQAYDFAIEHEEWMEKKLAELPAEIPLANGTIVPIFGTPHEIKVSYNSEARRTDIKAEGGVLFVRTNKEDPSGRIIRFLKAMAKDELTILSQDKAAKIGKTIQSVSVRDTKTRWGSCSADGNLSFSWRLIFAPYDSFDYVVAHEVAHLEHLNHGKDFWKLCDQLSENYKDGHSWMKKNSYELMRYT